MRPKKIVYCKKIDLCVFRLALVGGFNIGKIAHLFFKQNNSPNFDDEGKMTPLLDILLKEMQRVTLFSDRRPPTNFKTNEQHMAAVSHRVLNQEESKIYTYLPYGPQPSPACGVL